MNLLKNDSTKEPVSILLPTSNRFEPLTRCLSYLCQSTYEGDIEVVIAVDSDPYTLKSLASLAKEYNSNRSNFEIKVFHSEEKLYAIRAFDYAFRKSSHNYFFWISDVTMLTLPEWIENYLDTFKKIFKNDIGVMSLTQSGAGLGLSTKNFVAYNNLEWFYPGYRVLYADTELTARAILLGRFFKANGKTIFYDREAKKVYLSVDPKQKYIFRRDDKNLFSKRRENLFGLGNKIKFNWDFKEYVSVVMPL